MGFSIRPTCCLLRLLSSHSPRPLSMVGICLGIWQTITPSVAKGILHIGQCHPPWDRQHLNHISEQGAHTFQARTRLSHRLLASHVGTTFSILRRPNPTMCKGCAHTNTPYLFPGSFQNSAELSHMRLTNANPERHAPSSACGAHLRNSSSWQ